MSVELIDTLVDRVQYDGELPRREDLSVVFDELDYQMACQAYLWALPLVSYAQWKSSTTRLRGDGVRPRALSDLPRPARPHHGQRDDAVHPQLLRPGRDRAARHRACPPVRPPVESRTSGSARSARWARWAPTKGGAANTSSSRPGQEPAGRRRRLLRLAVDRDEHLVRVPHLGPGPGRAQALVDAVRIYPYVAARRPAADPAHLAGRASHGPATSRAGLEYWERLHDIYQREVVDERDRFYLAMLQAARHREGQAVRPRRTAHARS